MKFQNPSAHNLELLKTYYSNGKYSKHRKKKIQLNKARIIFNLFLAGVIVIVAAGYFFITGKLTAYNNEATGLFPSRSYGNVLYYNYGQIKNNKEPIGLDGQNKCAAIALNSAKNTAGCVIQFKAKGRNGSERIAVILKDNYNFSNANKNDIILTPMLSKDKWLNFTVKISSISLPLNKNEITQLRFDISEKLTENKPGAAVFIKEFSIK